MGAPLKESLEVLKQDMPVNDLLQEFAKAIDKRIHKLCRLWPNNYVAYDLLHGQEQFKNIYRDDDVEEFEAYCNTVLSDVKDDNGGREILLQKYAYPLQNVLNLSK